VRSAVERCAGDLVFTMLDIVENGDNPEDIQVGLITQGTKHKHIHESLNVRNLFVTLLDSALVQHFRNSLICIAK
jgi:hypothetical protein